MERGWALLGLSKLFNLLLITTFCSLICTVCKGTTLTKWRKPFVLGMNII